MINGSRPLRVLFFITIGIVVGAASWGSVSLVSDRFEPFDSDIGFWVSQAILIVAASWIGFRSGALPLLVFVLGAYVGINSFAYMFGGPEARAWATLGLFTSVGLLLLPATFGVFGKLLCVLLQARKESSA